MSTPVTQPIRLSDGTEIQPPPGVDCSDTDAPPEPRPRSSAAAVTLAALAILAVLYVARDVIVPVVFALVLALILRPLLRRMKGWGVPNGVSALLLVGTVVAVFVAGIWNLAGNAQAWLSEAPETVRRVGAMLPTNVGPMDDLKETTAAVRELTQSSEAGGSESPAIASTTPTQDWAFTVLGVSGHFLGASLITFVVCYFLLALSDEIVKQLVEAMPSFCEKKNVVQLVRNVEFGISRYLATITVINIGLGIVTGLAMWALGLPNPLLWGVMATALNYVPHVGAFTSMVVLFFVGAISHESLTHGAIAAGVFALFTTMESYFITPFVLSRSLQLSPLAVILAILFWGWMWGVGGGLLAAPLLAIGKIVCDQFQSLKPIGAMLAGGEGFAAPNGSTPAAPSKAAA
jgi:predicted PurR-regulated permease PerM